MELLFLALLIVLMVVALTSGFPVAFALPGSAILSVGIAALCGYLFAGDVDAYFAQDGPVQWLSAGVTNFRGVYWEVERDTLIAIPLFVFMGIMLQRSKIAEDLLVTMAQLFGPIPGGLGISVVFVGALLAATTGIVGATVVAMGLISLPAMLRNNYSKPLATGTICASGTLGQIIPPSIVLIILADQLSSAADQASTVRKSDYKEATGEFGMPSEFDVTSASAGDMFLGAFIPGLVLVGLYMTYILVVALIRPKLAPPVPYDGKYDYRFAFRVLLSLVPPLALIFAVLGSIVMGIATVNQAGAIGAIGAMIMAGYRLMEGKRGAFLPAILAVASITVILVLLANFDLNVKNISNQRDMVGVALAAIAVTVLLTAVFWSAWRAYRIDDTLRGVMIDTAKTTSMVFIILIGAAMLTAAFRGFGGEELVREFLTSLPGGFWTQFVVVMAVIFLLGFFLDFIEIAVVVVPIIAPILLSDPGANVTAVWLGVMIGINMQTSFLTPPFGFALFYLRGVAPPSVRTTHIYKGAVAFILLQLGGLAIAGTFPGLVNYLPNRTYLTSETAPPPKNPRLQFCMENYVFEEYRTREEEIKGAIEALKLIETDYLPEEVRTKLDEVTGSSLATFALVDEVHVAHRALAEFAEEYRPLHVQVRTIERNIRDLESELETLEKTFRRLSRGSEGATSTIPEIESQIEQLKERIHLEREKIPSEWSEARGAYVDLSSEEKKARTRYRRNVDNAYESLTELRAVIADGRQLEALSPRVESLASLTVASLEGEGVIDEIKSLEKALGNVEGAGKIKSGLTKARRALEKKPDARKAHAQILEAAQRHGAEVTWRLAAEERLLPALESFDQSISRTIGLRLQERLLTTEAEEIASCQSIHRDVSLEF